MSLASDSFLRRWSRLKHQGGEPVAAVPSASLAPPAPTAPLPDPANLGFDDDFTGFLRQEVEEGIRRVALKKLFHSAEFNVMDGLDTYIDDYSLPDPIDEATVRTLAHARELLFDAPAQPADTANAALADDATIVAGGTPIVTPDAPAGVPAAEGNAHGV